MELRSRVAWVLVGMLAVVGLCRSSHADLLNLPGGSPDIMSSSLTVAYDAGTDLFTAQSSNPGGAMFNVGGTPYTIANATYALSAEIDGSGALLSGSFSIEGTLLTLPTYSVVDLGPVMLTGNLTAFGFDPLGAELFEFTFDTTGGYLNGIFGSKGGIIITASGTDVFDGGFDANFTTPDGGANADTFAVAVPNPTAASVGFALLAGLAVHRRVMRARRAE